MMTKLNLPTSIKQLSVQSANAKNNPDLGILTHGTHHSFQYTQQETPISLTMKCRADAYNHGAIHPIFSQNLPEGFIRRYISEKLARYGRINDMYFLALQGANGIGALNFYAGVKLPAVEQISLQDILSWQSKEKLFPQLLEKYYLRGILSGVQPKVMINTEWKLHGIVSLLRLKRIYQTILKVMLLSVLISKKASAWPLKILRR